VALLSSLLLIVVAIISVPLARMVTKAASPAIGMQVTSQKNSYSSSSMANATTTTTTMTGMSGSSGGMSPAMKDEQDMMNLVPADQATAVAKANGLWSSAGTWQNGQIPGAGAKVVIPAGITVSYDGNSATALHWLRVDGVLQFVTTQNTAMLVETIVVPQDGTLIIGTQAQPIAGNVTASVTFADPGPLDTSNDPTRLGRGLVAEGTVTMFGQSRTAFVPLIPGASIPAGTTTLQLSKAPVNWHVGDMVALSGVLPGRSDEQTTIKAISGTSVTLSAALKLNHTAPANDLSVYLADYTRNITFQSANSKLDGKAADDFPNIARRGHIMFMGPAQVNLNGVQISSMGRSNKMAYTDNLGEYTKVSEYTEPGTGLNPRGRYALHFHYVMKPATVNDCTTMNDMGWGFVDHNSNTTMTNDAAYNVVSAFVEENGAGQGIMANNIAIGSNGSDEYGVRPSNDGDPHEDTVLNDMWHCGAGFSFRGQLVRVENNVATNQSCVAYIWDNWDAESTINIASNELPVPAITNNASTVNFSYAPISDFKGNVAAASLDGVRVDGLKGQGADSRHLIQDLTVYNVGPPYRAGGLPWGRGFAVQLRYNEHTTLRNLYLVDDYYNHTTVDTHNTHTGIDVGPENPQTVIDNAKIVGFGIGIDTAGAERTGDTPNLKPVMVLDSSLIGDTVNYTNTDAQHLKLMSKAGLDLQKLSFTLDPAHPLQMGNGFTLLGTISDSLGDRTTAFDGYGSDATTPGYAEEFSTSADTIHAMLSHGYYKDADGTTYVVLQYAIVNRLTVSYKVLNVRVPFDVNQWKPTGPDLGPYNGTLDLK
jgi:hypothetical protein